VVPASKTAERAWQEDGFHREGRGWNSASLPHFISSSSTRTFCDHGRERGESTEGGHRHQRVYHPHEQAVVWRHFQEESAARDQRGQAVRCQDHENCVSFFNPPQLSVEGTSLTMLFSPLLCSDVRIDTTLNKAIWAHGVKNVPKRFRIRLSRKRNEDEDAKEKVSACCRECHLLLRLTTLRLYRYSPTLLSLLRICYHTMSHHTPPYPPSTPPALSCRAAVHDCLLRRGERLPRPSDRDHRGVKPPILVVK
jgi:hypothetical protein